MPHIPFFVQPINSCLCCKGGGDSVALLHTRACDIRRLPSNVQKVTLFTKKNLTYADGTESRSERGPTKSTDWPVFSGCTSPVSPIRVPLRESFVYL